MLVILWTHFLLLDGDGVSDVKKASFTFGGSSQPPADPFKFGSTATTTSGSGLFTFSANKSTTSAPSSVFGAPTTTTSASSSFGTGKLLK